MLQIKSLSLPDGNSIVNMYSGDHAIDFFYNGMLVAGSPFISNVFNSAAVAISPVKMGRVGTPLEFFSKLSCTVLVTVYIILRRLLNSFRNSLLAELYLSIVVKTITC